MEGDYIVEKERGGEEREMVGGKMDTREGVLAGEKEEVK